MLISSESARDDSWHPKLGTCAFHNIRSTMNAFRQHMISQFKTAFKYVEKVAVVSNVV
jgi:hypothetical protein